MPRDRWFAPEPAWRPRHYAVGSVLIVLAINVTQVLTAPGIPAMLGL